MKKAKVILSITLVALTGVVAMDAASAQRVRARNVAKGAALTSTPEETEARQDAHQENQDTREERRKDASPNQKAVTANVAHSRHQQKVNAAASIKGR